MLVRTYFLNIVVQTLHSQTDKYILHNFQGRNHGENLGSTSAMQWWVESDPPGWDRVKVSENLGLSDTFLTLMETGDRDICDPATLCIQTYHVIR